MRENEASTMRTPIFEQKHMVDCDVDLALEVGETRLNDTEKLLARGIHQRYPSKINVPASQSLKSSLLTHPSEQRLLESATQAERGPKCLRSQRLFGSVFA